MAGTAERAERIGVPAWSILLSGLLSAAACSPPESPAATADAAADTPRPEERVSRPGEYRGYSEVRYDGHELTSRYVTVRDGTRLAIDIFRPTEDGEIVATPLPVVWMHTPYNRRYFRRGELTALAYPGEALKLVKHGYVVAVADFRGLYASYGTNRAYNRGEWHEAARWDAYDITEWLAEQSWSTGDVGMWGCSATGGSQLQAMTTAPPHLKAIFPMSCEFDVYPFAVAGGMSPPPGVPSRLHRGGSREERDRAAVPVDADSGRALLAEAVAEHENNVETAGHVPYRDSVSEALEQQWWLTSSPHTYLDAANASGVAVYAAANWDEGTTKHGAFFTFNNVDNPAKLVIGPEGHCDWREVRETTGFDIVVEELRFFDHWLKGIDNGIMDEPPVYYYTYNAPAGREWRAAEQWPLPNEQRSNWYLGDGNLTTAAAPGTSGAGDTVTIDYDAPPTLTYTTAPLAADLEITGHPVVNLWVSSTATDGDFIARLEDVAPDGTITSYHMDGRLRASHRKLDEPPYDNLGLPWHGHREQDAMPLTPGEPANLVFDLYPISYVFEAGHRIRLALEFVDPRATPRLDPAPTVTIHRDGDHDSFIALPVIGALPAAAGTE